MVPLWYGLYVGKSQVWRILKISFIPANGCWEVKICLKMAQKCHFYGQLHPKMGRYGILKYHCGMPYMLASLRCDGYSKESLNWPLEPHKWKSAFRMTQNYSKMTIYIFLDDIYFLKLMLAVSVVGIWSMCKVSTGLIKKWALSGLLCQAAQ